MTREELEYTLSLRHSHFTLGRETIAKLLTHDADQRQVIEQLEGRVKALEGALKRDPLFKQFLEQGFWHAHHVDIVWRYNGQDKRYEADWLKTIFYLLRPKAALAATGEEGESNL